MLSTLLIALSLAIDACAVSASTALSLPNFRLRHALTMGVWFGAFQFAMPVLGWLLGTGISSYIQAVDHFIAFGLLAFIGGRMVVGSLRGGDVEETAGGELSVRRLCLLAIATSIDALAVGVSMAFMADVNILLSALVIGVVAFLLSVAGGLLGNRLGALFRSRAELVGGLVLIAIGVRILIEHLTSEG